MQYEWALLLQGNKVLLHEKRKHGSCSIYYKSVVRIISIILLLFLTLLLTRRNEVCSFHHFSFVLYGTGGAKKLRAGTIQPAIKIPMAANQPQVWNVHPFWYQYFLG